MTSFPPPPGGGDDAPKRRRFVAIAPVASPVEAANEPQAAARDEEDFPLLTEVVSVAAAEPVPESDTLAAAEPSAPPPALPAEDFTLPAQPTPEIRASLLETLPPLAAAGGNAFALPPPADGEEGLPTSLVTPLSADLARALEARLAATLPSIVAEAQEAAQAVLRQRIEAATQAAIEGALADLLHATPPLPGGDHPA